MKTFLVYRAQGSRSTKGTPSRQQPLWDEHAAFMNALFDTGCIILAGPYADYNGAMLIVEAEDEAAAVDMFRDDPWTINDIMYTGSVREWLIFMDSREKQEG